MGTGVLSSSVAVPGAGRPANQVLWFPWRLRRLAGNYSDADTTLTESAALFAQATLENHAALHLTPACSRHLGGASVLGSESGIS